MTARNVMYWNTRKNPNSGLTVCSQLARLSNIGGSLLLFCMSDDGLHHPLHLHETRALDEDARGPRQFGQHRGIERMDVGEVPALHGDGLVAEREQLIDALGSRVFADFGVELRS